MDEAKAAVGCMDGAGGGGEGLGGRGRGSSAIYI